MAIETFAHTQTGGRGGNFPACDSERPLVPVFGVSDQVHDAGAIDVTNIEEY